MFNNYAKHWHKDWKLWQFIAISHVLYDKLEERRTLFAANFPLAAVKHISGWCKWISKIFAFEIFAYLLRLSRLSCIQKRLLPGVVHMKTTFSFSHLFGHFTHFSVFYFKLKFVNAKKSLINYIGVLHTLWTITELLLSYSIVNHSIA